MTKELPPHSVIRPLGLGDVEQFLQLEEKGFPPEERCTREKALYRLRICPELSTGVFLRQFDSHDEQDSVSRGSGDSDSSSDDGVRPARIPVLSGASTLKKERLIAHVLATKMVTDHVTDEAMEIPELDKYGRRVDDKDPRGHREEGRCIGIHAVVVDPEFQGMSIGSLMLRDYIQRITTQHIADSIALIAHDRLVPFYQRLDFIDDGPSPVKLAGGGWRHVWVPLASTDDDE